MAKHYHDLLPFYLNGRLPVTERIALEQHLLSCQQCRAALDEWRTLADAVSREAASRTADLPPLSPQLYRAQQEPATTMPSTSSRRNSFLRKWNIEESVTIRRPSAKDGEDKDMNTTYDVSLESARPLQFPDTRRLIFDPITWVAAVLAIVVLGAILIYMGVAPGPIDSEMLNQPYNSGTPITGDNIDQLEQVIVLGQGQALRVAWSGQTLALAGTQGIVRLYDVNRLDTPPRLLQGHSGFIVSLAFSPDGRLLASGSADNTTRLWNVTSEETIATLETQAANDVTFSPDGSLLAAAVDHDIQLWDVSTGTERIVLSGHEDKVNSVAFNPDGTILASASSDHTVRLWNVITGAPLAVLQGHEDDVRSVTFNADGGIIASGGGDGTIWLWDWDGVTGTRGVILRGHTDGIRSLAFSGQTLASASLDHTVRLWDITTGASRVLEGHTNRVMGIAFDPDGRTLASTSFDESLRLWDTSSGEQVRVIQTPAGELANTTAIFSPDGRTLASAGTRGLVLLWDIPTGTVRARLEGHSTSVTGHVWCLAFSPDGRTLVSGGDDRTVRLWDVATGQQRALLEGHTAEVDCVAYSPDGQSIASSSCDGTVRIWDVATSEVRSILRADTCVIGVAYSPDGQLLASSDGIGTVLLWDVATGSRVATLRSDRQEFVGRVTFSPDGNLVALGSMNGTIWLWDVATHEEHAVLEGHEANVLGLAFSPDGRLLVSGSSFYEYLATADTSVRFWDVTTGELLRTLEPYPSSIRNTRFNSDGTMMAVALADGTIRLWAIPVQTQGDGS